MDNLDKDIKKFKIVLKVGDIIDILDKLKINFEENKKWDIDEPEIINLDNKFIITALKKGSTYIEMFSIGNRVPNYIIKINVLDKKINTNINDKNLNIIDISHNKYSYEILENNINKLCSTYKDILNYEILCESYDNRNIYLLTLGNKNSKYTLFIQASMHGREYMLSLIHIF